MTVDLISEIFAQVIQSIAGNVNETNAFFFKYLGTSEVAQTFYDNVDNGFFLRKKMGLKNKRIIATLLNNVFFITLCKLIMYLTLVMVYYVDVLKDAYLAGRLYIFWGHILPNILFALTIASIIFGQIANLFIVINFKAWSRNEKLLGALFIPMVPAFISYRIYRLEVALKKRVRNGAPGDELLQLRQSAEELKGLRSEMRANENFLEHLPQLVILLLLMLIKMSRVTTTVPIYLSSNLVPDNQVIFTASAMMSFFSLARGQLSNLSAKKNGHVPFLGKLVLLSYYSLGTAARVFAVLLFFTPRLGIFYTFFHFTLGSQTNTGYGPDNLNPVFDIYANGTIIYDNIWGDKYHLDKIEDL